MDSMCMFPIYIETFETQILQHGHSKYPIGIVTRGIRN